MKKLYFKSQEYFLYLLPLTIILSNFFTNFIVYYISIFGAYQLLLKKKYDLINNTYCKIFIIFCLFITLRSLFLEDGVLYSLKSSLTLIRYLFFYIAIVTIIENKILNIRTFMFFLGLLLLFILVDSSIQFLTEENLFGLKEQISNRISSIFAGRFVLGTYVSKTIFLLIFLLNFIYPIQKFKFIYLCIILASLFLILISGDRAALLIYILTLFLFILLFSNNILNLKYKISILSFILLFIVSSISFSSTLKSRLVDQTINDLKTTENIFYFSKGHESHWKTSFKMFKENKFYGVGANMFRKKCDLPNYNSGKKSCSTHPHNYYFQLLAETGLIGFLLFGFVYIIVGFNLLKQFFYVNFKKKDFLKLNTLFMFIFFFSFFCPLISTGNLFGSFTMNLIALPICFIKSTNVK